MGSAYKLCPSVLEFVDTAWEGELRERVVNYLMTSPVVAVTSRIAFPCVFHGLNCPSLRTEPDSLAARGDGVWNWSPDLPHYIEHHGVRVPDAMLAHMQRCGFQPPRNLPETIACLPEPPLLEGAHRNPQVLFPLATPQEIETIVAQAEQHFRNGEYHQAATMFLQVRECLNAVQQQKLQYAQRHAH